MSNLNLQGMVALVLVLGETGEGTMAETVLEAMEGMEGTVVEAAIERKHRQDV